MFKNAVNERSASAILYYVPRQRRDNIQPIISGISNTNTHTYTQPNMDLRCQDVYLCYDSLLGLRLGQPTIIFAAWYSQQF